MHSPAMDSDSLGFERCDHLVPGPAVGHYAMQCSGIADAPASQLHQRIAPAALCQGVVGKVQEVRVGGESVMASRRPRAQMNALLRAISAIVLQSDSPLPED
jgi:hypothetical protein